MRPGTVWQFAGYLMLATAVVTGVSAQSREAEPAEPVREQQADQQGAIAGEAPPAPVQSARTPEDEAEPAREPGSQAETPAPGVKSPPKDAAEHLARVEEIVREALDERRGGEPPDEREPIGTAGTPMTAQTGEVVTIERAKLEEIQLHLEQIRTALAARPR